MGKGINLLSARFVATTLKVGRHSDGGSLCLLVRKRSDEIERLWVFRYRRGGRGSIKETTLSLGSARDVTLATARDLASQCRSALAAGKDPKAVLSAGEKKVPTFGKVADDLIDHLAPGFTGKKTLAAWKLTLGEVYCSSIREKPVDQVTTEDLLKILSPIWMTKPETALKMRSRMERVFDSAKVLGHRKGGNPAIWKANLKVILPTQPKLIRGHHEALPWADMPWFIKALREHDTNTAAALEWPILTAARTSETIGTPRTGRSRETCGRCRQSV